MSNPKFQDPDVPATTYTLPDEALPALPSDNFLKEVPRFQGISRMERNGLPVAIYKRDWRRQWDFSMRNVPEAAVYYASNVNLWTFARLIVFDFYPDASLTTKWRVEWLNPELYKPQLQGGGTYDLAFSIREWRRTV